MRFTSRLLTLAVLVLSVPSGIYAQALQLKKGDNIAIVGSGLADRQQHHAWLESLIYKANPELELVVRNLGFAADEVNVHPRSDEVPTTEYFLNMKPGTLETKAGKVDVVYRAGADFHANVILAYWGFNESFKGEAGLPDFRTSLDAWLKAQLAADYGKGKPKVILFSPLAHENLKDPVNFPDGSANNKNLSLYAKAMAEVAASNQVPFVDLFTASQGLFSASAQPMTINGIHLTEAGDKALAPVQFKALFGAEAPALADSGLDAIRTAVLEKNVQWHHRYRTVDQYNIYGSRSRGKYEGVDNATILGQEMAQRDVKVANRDRAVWAAAQGKKVAVKDDNLPPVDLTPPNRKEAVPYLDGREALQYLTTPEGCKVDFVASEKEFPELINPVQMNFDTKGRLWVSAWPTYPETTPTTTNFDKLLVFDIDPKTGLFTKCTTFADGLNCPTGFQLYKDGVLVMQSPDMWFMRDTDGDGKADWKERLVHGLDAADSHHETNSICYEPGGAVYFSDGVFHRTNVETLNGPVRNVNGAIYRFEPRTSRFERYVAYGFANPHGRVFDYWGNDIITDATGNANYFGPGFSGHLDTGAHSGYFAFWDRPSRPCPGTAILSSRHFPEDWQGEFLNCNVISFQGIYRAKMAEEGSGLRGTTVMKAGAPPKDPGAKLSKEEAKIAASNGVDAMLSTDIAKNPNFRPSGVAVAPDGSLYVMDWSQMLIGHLQHHLRDPNRDHQHGRIYRITYPGRPLLTPKAIAGQPVESLLELLKEHEDNVRMRAKIELDTHDTKQVIAALDKWTAALDKTDKNYEHHRLEALWVHQWHNIVDPGLLQAVLASPEPRARAQAVRVLCYWRDRVPTALDLLKTAISDSAPRVRLEAIRALSFFSGDDAAKASVIALDLWKNESDRYLDYCFKETMRQLGTLTGGKNVLPSDPVLLAKIISKMDDKDLASQPHDSEAVLMAQLERRSYDLARRQTIISDLARVKKLDTASALVTAFKHLDEQGNDAAAAELTRVLTATTPSDLAKARPAFIDLATSAKRGIAAKAAWAAVIIGDGKAETSWNEAKEDKQRESIISAIPLIVDPALRSQFQEKLAALAPANRNIQRARLAALPTMGPEHAKANFPLLAKALIDGQERAAAGAAIMALPRDSWDKAHAGAIAQSLLAYATKLDSGARTKQDFVELNQLAMEMAALAGDASLRKQLRGLGVPVFVVKAVREQMRFDTTRIVVEPGKPFEIILVNSDVMPHNLVVVGRDQHAEIAAKTLTMPPDKKDRQGRAYLPDPKDFRFMEATKLLEPGEKETIPMKGIAREGEYEYVCTFPGHGLLMWGKIIVTKDVDAWLQANPTGGAPPAAAPAPEPNPKPKPKEAAAAAPGGAAKPLTYEGTAGALNGKQIVLIASDHEYKSEEALPELARILAKHHGAKCTVLFGLDEKTGNIKPGNSNIPGTEALKTADLMVIFTRFQNLPAEQMQPIVDYLHRGGPVVGLRTATHAFKIPADSPFAKYTHDFKGAGFEGGFGRQILGETWVGHYGPNHKSSTRLDIVPGQAAHPVLTGVKEMWAEIGAYNAAPIAGSQVLAMAQPLTGMTADSPADAGKVPMPGAWVRTYKSESGKEGRVFASTYGASGDLLNEGFRRMLVNACFWAAGAEAAIKPGNEISIVGGYRPTWMGTAGRARSVKPEQFAGWDAPVWPEQGK